MSENTCIRCGKACPAGKSMCSDCEKWLEEKQKGAPARSFLRKTPAAPELVPAPRPATRPAETAPVEPTYEPVREELRQEEPQSFEPDAEFEAEAMSAAEPADESEGGSTTGFTPNAAAARKAPDKRILFGIGGAVLVLVLVLLLIPRGSKAEKIDGNNTASGYGYTQDEYAPSDGYAGDSYGTEPAGEGYVEAAPAEPSFGEGQPAQQPEIVQDEPIAFYTGSLSGYEQLYISGAYASSEISDNGKVYWATNAIDGDLNTSWQEDAEDDGIGEYLALSFDGSVRVDMLRLRLGYAPYYERNGRPKQLQLDFSDGTSVLCDFEDVNKDFYIKLGSGITTDSLFITITDVYTGSQWSDTCITEVTCYQKTAG